MVVALQYAEKALTLGRKKTNRRFYQKVNRNIFLVL